MREDDLRFGQRNHPGDYEKVRWVARGIRETRASNKARPETGMPDPTVDDRRRHIPLRATNDAAFPRPVTAPGIADFQILT
jgi:hypothetical protein